MCHVAHQCICMQYLLELAKQLECDPRACISSFSFLKTLKRKPKLNKRKRIKPRRRKFTKSRFLLFNESLCYHNQFQFYFI